MVTHSRAENPLPAGFFGRNLLLPMLVMALGLIIVISELGNVLQRFLPVPDWFMEMLTELGLGQGFALGTFIVLVVVAPLTEEPIFRGILLHGFARNYGTKWAVFGTAFLFGAIHMNPWQFLGAFFLGLAFAWWTLQTKSLLPALIGHALNNGMVVVMADVLKVEIQGFSAWEEGVHAHQPWWFTLAGVGATGWWGDFVSDVVAGVKVHNAPLHGSASSINSGHIWLLGKSTFAARVGHCSRADRSVAKHDYRERHSQRTLIMKIIASTA